jgi:hypothetical protein
MLVINSKSDKNGKPEWACKTCKPDKESALAKGIRKLLDTEVKPKETTLEEPSPIRVHYRKGIHYLFFVPDELISKTSLPWGDSELIPDQKYNSIGNGKRRTTLDIGEELQYHGVLKEGKITHVLFKTDEYTEKAYYIAPLYVNNKCLLMPSAENAFWDIQAFDSKQTIRDKKTTLREPAAIDDSTIEEQKRLTPDSYGNLVFPAGANRNAIDIDPKGWIGYLTRNKLWVYEFNNQLLSSKENPDEWTELTPMGFRDIKELLSVISDELIPYKK